MRILERKHVVVVDTGFRRLVYPLDHSLVRDLDTKLVGRWVKAGWSSDKTVMLEIDYATIPGYRSPEKAIASNVFAGVIYAWNTGKYYKVVTFSSGYFEGVDEVNIEADAYHEGLHLKSYEDSLLTGSKPLTEDDVVKAEVGYVREHHGEKGFALRGRHVLTLAEKLTKVDAIPGAVILVWLREYLEEKQTKYNQLAFPIPHDSEVVERIRRMQYSMVEHVTALYRTALNLNPSLLFMHCLNKTNCSQSVSGGTER